MAQRTIVELIDDVEGGKADETVLFSLDGKTYEIDLSDKNAGKLRKALAPYIEAGRKQSAKTGSRTAARPTRTTQVGPDSATLRVWGRANGFPVNERGRVSQEIKDAYAKAHP
ncbi:histone-like nucleoid-structuring protein Lsr2 [Streptomyces hydrogenans]|uniref:histone-like nucleoid-structuring protein Lsr2 n=1 Tax=Streptomyces hydrogenans TaxID=1873719 RepID=UPI0035D93D16